MYSQCVCPMCISSVYVQCVCPVCMSSMYVAVVVVELTQTPEDDPRKLVIYAWNANEVITVDAYG